MKRFNIFATMALAMVLGLGAAIGIGSGTKEVKSAEAAISAGQYAYVILNDNWKSAKPPRISAVFNDSSNVWANATIVSKVLYNGGSTDNSVYRVQVPAGQTKNIDFCRMKNTTTTNDWNNKWDDTGFISFSTFTTNTICITGWSNAYSVNDSSIWSLTKKEVVNGVVGSTIGTDYVYSSYTYIPGNPTKSGYTFIKWYSNQECTTEWNGSMTRDTTIYAKYVTANVPYIVGDFNSWNVGANSLSNYNGNYKKITGLSITKLQEFKMFYNGTWYGADYCFKDNDGSACFDIVRGGDSNIKCNTTGVFDIVFNVSSHYIYIYKSTLPSGDSSAGYYLIGTNEFGDWSLANAMKMGTGTGNVGVIESSTGMSLTTNTEFKVIYYDGIARVIYYNIYSAGGTFVNTDWTFNYDGGKARYTGTSGSFNFYLQSVEGGSYEENQNVAGTANFYIVDVGEIDKFGMLYIASNQDSSTLKITSKVGTSTTVLDNVLLSSVTGFVEYSRVTGFDGYSHLYVVPVFNLRGGDSSKLVDRVIVNDTTRTITGIPTTKGSAINYYYAKSGAASNPNGKAAYAVVTIDEYINNATNQSVCNLSKADATTLMNLYDVATIAGSTLHQTATINTYTSTYEQGTKGSVAVSAIYAQIVSIATNGHPLGRSFLNVNFFKLTKEGNIILVCLVSSLVAIGAFAGYFFYKKKKEDR